MSKRKLIDRALGPYRYDDHWMVAIVPAVVVEGEPKRRVKTYPFTATTEETRRLEAQRYVDRFNEAARLAQGVTLEEAIAGFTVRMQKRLRPGTVTTNLIRLGNFFPPEVQRTPVSALDRPFCAQLYAEMAARPDSRPGHEGNLPSTDTALNTLSVARQLLDFCAEQKWARSNPLGQAREPGRFRPEDPGERNPGGKGKKQLNFDALALWEAKAYELAEDGDDGAAAGLIALKLGLRAAIIVTRQVSHVDLEGAILRVPRDGPINRTKRAPEIIPVMDARLRPVLASLKEGKPADGWLFPGERTRQTGHRDRNWVADQIRRVCRLAGVPEDTHAHGMRGASASLDLIDGKALAEIQQWLAHRQGSDVTHGSYLTAEAITRNRQRRIMQVIPGGKKKPGGG
jgi:integrase